MSESYSDHDVLRYCRQAVLKAMDSVRASMRGSDWLLLKNVVEGHGVGKSPLNLTKGIDALAEKLILAALEKKLVGKLGIRPLTLFSEEMGIRTLPEGAS
jgi:hypothetical protein